MNKRHYEHTLPNIRGSLSNTYDIRWLTDFSLCYFLALLNSKLYFKDNKIKVGT